MLYLKRDGNQYTIILQRLRLFKSLIGHFSHWLCLYASRMWSMETCVSSLTPWTPISRRVSLRSWTAHLRRCRRNWKTSEHAMPSSVFTSGRSTMRKSIVFLGFPWLWSQLSYYKYSNILVSAEGSSPFNWSQLEAVTVPVVNDLVLHEMTVGTVLSTKHLSF